MDPWLTVAEIAEALRVNPATVRLWISKGALPAMRAGQRKLLIRRSDLDRMLEVTRAEAPVNAYEPRVRDPRHPNWSPAPQSIRQLSTADFHGQRVTPEEMQQILEELQLADEAWERAQTASEHAPPDPGFPYRVRALAEACDRQAQSVGDAARSEGFAWTPLPERRPLTLSPELRPGANRPGPAELWAEFDRAVQRLGIAMAGSVMYVVAFQYRDLAAVMHRIADLLLGEAPDTRGRSQ
ncbi:MAG: helix-turn-helix domain-containing protein [Solirubrobacterales bacterium]|nr:helix-turn-helix domain-containing protein [Solirubrobacterales bacterium]